MNAWCLLGEAWEIARESNIDDHHDERLVGRSLWVMQSIYIYMQLGLDSTCMLINKSREQSILMEGSMLSRNFGDIHGCKSLHDSADARPSSHHCCCGWLGSKASISTVSHNKLFICR